MIILEEQKQTEQPISNTSTGSQNIPQTKPTQQGQPVAPKKGCGCSRAKRPKK